MKTKLHTLLCLSLLLCALLTQAVAEEGVGPAVTFDFPETICLAADADVVVPPLAADGQVPLYTATLFDFQTYFAPSLFPEGMLLNVEEHATPEASGTVDEKSVGFWLQDGSYLYLPSALSMVWMGENASAYHQLLRYLYDADVALEQRQLDFMSPAAAVSLCDDLLAKMHLQHLTATAVYGLSGDDLATYTHQMSVDYSDMKLERIDPITAHDAVYCVAFRSVLDTVPTVGDAPFPLNGGAQCLFVVRKDGPVYIEISKVIEGFDAVTMQPATLALEDALRRFCAGKEVSRSDADHYEITRIAYGYAESVDSVPAYADMRTTYVPYYQVDYVYTMRFGDQEKRMPCEALINAVDGAIIQIRGI